ncbi:LapA family protein [Candidatus Kaiserbacteria bacterium]|nr:MAG: LapA family protein [Candidatus Kaiserbacteria bacterium]
MIRSITSGIIIFAVVWFAVTNASAIHINAFLWNISVSTAVVVFISFALGFIFGVVRIAPSWFKKRMQVGKGHKALDICIQENKEHSERIKQLEMELALERQQAKQGEEKQSQ